MTSPAIDSTKDEMLNRKVSLEKEATAIGSDIFKEVINTPA